MCWTPKIGQSKKDDPSDVARIGYDAMMRGAGCRQRLNEQAALGIANIKPAGVLAEMHRNMAEPRTETRESLRQQCCFSRRTASLLTTAGKSRQFRTRSLGTPPLRAISTPQCTRAISPVA
jgi:hypothetical protein